jgi:hypothetical protein
LRPYSDQYMKKSIVWLLAILILVIACIYLVIPAKIVISGLDTVSIIKSAEFRLISQEEYWDKWWRDADGKPHIKGEPFRYNGSVFRILKKQEDIVIIGISRAGMQLNSTISLITIHNNLNGAGILNNNSIGAVWRCEIDAGNNPLTRTQKYISAIQVKRDMNGIMQNLTSFAANPDNVYGSHIFMTVYTNPFTLSARFTSPNYPSTTQLYGYFDVVEKAIQKQNGIKTGFPMVNIVTMNNDSFETQVAIPTTKEMKNAGPVLSKRLIPGNFVCTEVKGGPFIVEEARNEVQNFVSDYGKNRIANPFQLLITDRMKETDTTKWVTKLYQPVVE